MKAKVFFLIPMFLLFLGCSSDNDVPEKTLKPVTYEVLLFEFTADTGNNSSRLHYEIKYTNPNDVAVKGTSSVTANYNGLILTPIKRVPPYIEIGANSTYTEVYNVESPHDTQSLSPEQIKTYYIKFVSANFVFAID
ncbi:hypothetical protein [Flavobacterium sp. 1355]|uniref:hypothetical protein n=1 Tax=Flavobacterium sp. 1355 TaxID=2806571 RepID=UPI001AE7C6D6|nr:hypothetical protein [Flavobacterium sp. 1355]MBP1221566.1 hypothetical protein [Flavobacterium sp. 1355]